MDGFIFHHPDGNSRATETDGPNFEKVTTKFKQAGRFLHE
jgi:hypothetical protein